MRVRVPPGRMGRLWLRGRLGVAARAAEVLEEKVRVLLAEEERLRTLASEAEERWVETCAGAGRWMRRAGMLTGERELDVVSSYVAGPFDVDVRWRGAMGVTYPDEVRAGPPDPVPFATLGGSSALGFAGRAYRDAADAALRYGAARRAHEVVRDELLATRRRLRAIERRWVPALRDALHDLELQLDEVEREDVIRSKWVVERSASRR